MLDGRRTELVARLLAHLFHPAKPDHRLPPRFVQRHAGAPVLLGLLLDMEADLVVEPVLELPAKDQRTQPPQHVSERSHQPSQFTVVTSSTRLIARDMRRHCASESVR
jgi:hypothetical protein